MRNPAANERGMSLVEVVVTSVITAGIMFVIGSVLKTAQNNFYLGMTLSGIQDQSRWAVDKIATEVQQGGVATFLPDPGVEGTTTLTFQKSAGVTGGVITWGTAITYAFQYETGETNDGLDNNSNGLVDEGMVVRIEGTQTSVITRWVKEGGFLLTRSGNILSIQLDLQRSDGEGRLLSARTISSVIVKN
ncbi:MAG: hypothetical protein V1809_07265 [Planctomycetota bacterium]